MAITLTTLAKIKTHLGITVSTYDTQLTAMAEAAEGRIFEYTNRPDGFASGSHTEYFDGEWFPTLPALLYSPITAVASVKIIRGEGSSETLDLSTMSIDGLPLDGTAFSTRVGIIAMRSRGATNWEHGDPYVSGPSIRGVPNFGGGFRRVQVIYTGGYGTIPAALDFATIEFTAHIWRRKDRDPALKSESLGDYSYTLADFASDAQAIPSQVRDLIDPYRRRVGL